MFSATGNPMQLTKIVYLDAVLNLKMAAKIKSKKICFNSLTATIRGSGYTFFVIWRRYPGARLERYLQNGAVIRGGARLERYLQNVVRMPGFTHNKIFFLMISMVLL